MNTTWKKDEIIYIINNWKSVPDYLMAKKLGRTQRAIKAKRNELELYRIDPNHLSYENISKYLRGNNQQWKNDSMKHCNYKCVLTGSKDFHIHHLYNVNSIITDIFQKYPNLKKESLSNYTSDELSFLVDLFIEEQGKYPLGECIDVKLHKLFHSLYGQYRNTPEQWKEFKINYKNGIYNGY